MPFKSRASAALAACEAGAGASSLGTSASLVISEVPFLLLLLHGACLVMIDEPADALGGLCIDRFVDDALQIGQRRSRSRR